MSSQFDSWTTIYNRGVAVGESNVRNDTMTFRFRDEVFELPALVAHPHTYFNGYFVEIPIEKLRELKAEQEKKNG